MSKSDFVLFLPKIYTLTKLSIIIVNFNARFFLQSCIESILESEDVKDLEIIVVDNNSSDGSCAMLELRFPEVKLIRNKKNVGFSTANNMGVDQALGTYVLILNPDTILDRLTLSKVISFYKNTENCGAVGVRFIDGSGKFLPECKRNFPSIGVAFQKLVGLSKAYYASEIDEDENSKVAILSGAFLFVKRERYLEIGGFDEDFFMYGEDIDLCYRFSMAGYRNFYLGESSIIHFKGQSTPRDRNYIKNFYGAFRIFYKKHFRLNTLLDIFIHFSIQVMIFLKSFFVRSRKKTRTDFTDFIYAGDREEIFNKLEILYPVAQGYRCKDLKVNERNRDRLFIDTGSLGYSEVLNHMKHNRATSEQIRIISKDGTYFLGSDDATSMGEVYSFSQA